MKQFVGFVVTTVLNLFLLWAANQLLPGNYVILSFMGSWLLALLATALVWTVITFLTQPVAGLLKIKLKKGLEMAAAFLVANFVAIWGVARIGLGFGVRSFIWVAVLAIAANIAQFLVWVLLTKLKLAEM